MDTYSKPEAHRIAGITYRQIDYWLHTGLVTNSVGGTKLGARRRFTYRDLIAIRAISTLLEAGVSLQAIRRVQTRLVEFKGDDDLLSQGRLVIEQGKKKPDVGIATSDDEVLRLLNEPGQSAMRTVFSMAPVYADVDKGLRKLSTERARKQRTLKATG